MCSSMEMVLERRNNNNIIYKARTLRKSGIHFKKQKPETHINGLYQFLLNQKVPSCVRKILSDDDNYNDNVDNDNDNDNDNDKRNNTTRTYTALEIDTANILLSFI